MDIQSVVNWVDSGEPMAVRPRMTSVECQSIRALTHSGSPALQECLEAPPDFTQIDHPIDLGSPLLTRLGYNSAP